MSIRREMSFFKLDFVGSVILSGKFQEIIRCRNEELDTMATSGVKARCRMTVGSPLRTTPSSGDTKEE
jgi:hypothetical protein